MTIVKTIPNGEKCDGVEVCMEKTDVLVSTIYKNARKRHCRTKDQIPEIWHWAMMPCSESEEVIGGASEIQTNANKLDNLKKGLKRLNQGLGIHVLVNAFFQDKITIQKDHQRWGECVVLPIEQQRQIVQWISAGFQLSIGKNPPIEINVSRIFCIKLHSVKMRRKLFDDTRFFKHLGFHFAAIRAPIGMKIKKHGLWVDTQRVFQLLKRQPKVRA
jgi:hypothetical protein